eukprot:GHVQ01013883.1.p1 GENE.GHVQ01013883.1~~GHVQ01013883.1.p1  ORF type:complete len:341 (+),score=69.11 GHVQ01013883.1:451-1473(+)
MTEFGDSLEELEEKLLQYRQQLDAVEAALEEQPEEQALQKLQSDLHEVIALTEDLAKFQRQSVPQPTAALEEQQSAAASETVAGRDTWVGRTCEAVYEGERYLGLIVQIKNDPATGEKRVLVDFLCWHNREEYKLNQIRIFQPPHPSLLPPGAKAYAVYEKLGEWHECVIQERLSNGGYSVAFPGHSNLKLDVNFDQVRLVGGTAQQSQKAAAQAAQLRKKVKEIITPGGYRIPEFLTAKPNDTEAQRQNKKRKVQQIKKQQRLEQQEQEAVMRVSGWKKFASKATNKKTKGFLTGRNRESIFRSSDEVKAAGTAAAAAGAAQSGFLPRRKHDFGGGVED